jgi:hypothetical protein
MHGNGSAMLSIVLVGAVALAAGGCQTVPATPSPTPALGGSMPMSPAPTATATPTPATILAPTPTPSPAVGAWNPAPDSPALDQAQFVCVVWTGSRFVAGATLMNGSAVFLDSSDGTSWHAQSASWPDAIIRALAVGPGGLVAVGDKAGRMVGWTSTDGLSWSLAPDAAAMNPAAGKTFRLQGVTAVSGGWMAVGAEYPSCMVGCVPDRAVVWKSPDGVAWSRSPAAAPLANAGMTGVVQWKGGFVAVGSAGKSAAVWTSSDAVAWARVTDSPVFHAPTGTDQTIGATISAIAAGSDRLVAVGQVLTQGDVESALPWWSSDGVTWNAATGEDFLDGQIFGVAAVPTGYLAVGPSGPPSCLGGIWSSTDGTSWKCEASTAGFDGFAPYAAAASPTLEIVVGFGRPGGAITGAVWTRTIAAP